LDPFQGNADGFGSGQRDATGVPLPVAMATSRHEQGDVPTRDAQVMLTGMGMFQQTVDVSLFQRHTTQVPIILSAIRQERKEITLDKGSNKLHSSQLQGG